MKGVKRYDANPILLQKKYSRVIECFVKRQRISLDAALDFFYHSEVYQLIRDGVSDMHCMSDAYSAEELEQEYADKMPDNYASQALFEKLGAEPNGISEFWIHDEESIRKCEEENLHLIDEKLCKVAKKFEVEPRKLLSHVLEYKLRWIDKI